MADDELTYEPLEPPAKGKKKGIQRKAPIRQSAGEKRQPPKTPLLPPSITSLLTPKTSAKIDVNLTQEILYVCRLDKLNQQETTAPAIQVETWWRSADTENRQPARQLYLEESTLAPTPLDAALFSMLLNMSVRLSAYSFHVPAALFSRFGDAASQNRLRSIEVENGTKKMYRLQFSNLPAQLNLSSQLQPNGDFEVVPYLVQGETAISFSMIYRIVQPRHAPPLPRPSALVFSNHTVIAANLLGAASILGQFIGHHSRMLDAAEATLFTRQMTAETELPLQDAPSASHLDSLEVQPAGELYVRTAKYLHGDKEMLHAELSFSYGNFTLPDENSENGEMRVTRGNTVIIRNSFDENRLRTRLTQLGFRYNKAIYKEELGWKLEPAQLNNAVQTLVMEGWKVTAEGKSYSKPTLKMPSVSSGLDWFEMSSGISFNGHEIGVPEILAACKNGSKSVLLDDGTYGILPEEWLLNFTALTQIGDVTSDKLRFRIQQAALVNALMQDRLAENAPALRDVLQRFEALGVPSPAKPPAGFNATLRPYQEIGLGWLLAMQKNGFGACLADDMGLGKTIQVLAVLEGIRQQPEHLPSLIVLPCSLIFNWQEEVRKFAPKLTMLVHHGAGRCISQSHFNQYDLVFTTYGTLRNDAVKMGDIQFEYCILDESQNIKNYESSTAKAARCICARYRIAMTGTPIENSLVELFSQLDFLNPGLFNMAAFAKKSAAALETMHQGVKPFILRRTKQEVAKELPPKTEQILWCQMEDDEKAAYNELLAYYQQQIFGENASNAQDMQVLAALTRLRQAACHPALLNSNKANDSSAKLSLLMDNLRSITAAGHKALVFSQFTSFLKIIRANLEKEDCQYCYLDGETKERAQLVETFQNNPDKMVFLISLKAGGVGLNLTAAEYVFLVDPWWNPAAEAQAIDRAYRIGQKSPVFAYRMVTKGTIEERVIQLQQQKKQIADAVINSNNSMPAKLTGEELRSLLKP